MRKRWAARNRRRLWPSGARWSFKECFDFGFVEARELLLALDDDGAFEQISVCDHQLDRVVFRGRLLPHVFFSIKRRSGIQKTLDRFIADELAQFLFGERIFAVFTLLEIGFFCLQETSCFAASRSRRLINK